MNSEKLNFSIGNFTDKYLSEREKYLRQKSKIKIFTLEEVRDFVLKQSVSDEIKQELLTLLNKYPHAAYNNFIQNINKNIQIIMDKRKEYLKTIYPEKKAKTKSNNNIDNVKFEDLKEETNNEEKLDSKPKSILEELKEEFN